MASVVHIRQLTWPSDPTDLERTCCGLPINEVLSPEGTTDFRVQMLLAPIWFDLHDHSLCQACLTVAKLTTNL